MMINLVDRQK